jgi:hypothetical protein
MLEPGSAGFDCASLPIDERRSCGAARRHHSMAVFEACKEPGVDVRLLGRCNGPERDRANRSTALHQLTGIDGDLAAAADHDDAAIVGQNAKALIEGLKGQQGCPHRPVGGSQSSRWAERVYTCSDWATHLLRFASSEKLPTLDKLANQTVPQTETNDAAVARASLIAADIADATTYKDIAGQWCGDVTDYVFTPNALTVKFHDGRSDNVFKITKYNYTNDSVRIDWLTPLAKSR